ncbi:MAG: hypothetical protein ACR2NM_01060 [Bythopirellula sp.]
MNSPVDPRSGERSYVEKRESLSLSSYDSIGLLPDAELELCLRFVLVAGCQIVKEKFR